MRCVILQTGYLPRDINMCFNNDTSCSHQILHRHFETDHTNLECKQYEMVAPNPRSQI